MNLNSSFICLHFFCENFVKQWYDLFVSVHCVCVCIYGGWNVGRALYVVVKTETQISKSMYRTTSILEMERYL
jgi:hypothetical protein